MADQYNSDLYGLLREPQKVLNINYLEFLRQLAEAGKLEHEVAGPPCGGDVGRRLPAYSGKLS